MKPFFSILSINLNANFDEKISIGLVMSNGERSYFRASFTKLNAVKGIIPLAKSAYIKTYLKNIQTEIENIDSSKELYKVNNFSEKWITHPYLDYLNKYSNNILIFSEAKTIDVDLNEETFNVFFNSFIFSNETSVSSRVDENSIIKRVENKLYPKIQERVNLNITIRQSDFSELISPVEVDFIGKNGVIVAGQTIDFNKRAYNLENDITRFISFSKAVDYEDQKNKGKYFIVGKEPNRNISDNHKTWENIKSSHMVEYVDISELGRIEEYMNEKDVKPWTTPEFN